LVAGSNVVAWMKDEQGRYVFASNGFKCRCVPRNSVVLGKTDFDIWPRAIAEALRQNDQTVLKFGDTIEVCEEFSSAEGVLSQWRTHKFLYRDGTGRAFVCSLAVEITSYVKTEQALRQSERQLRLAIDAGGIGTYRIDYMTGLATYSFELANMLGSPGTTVESHEAAARRVHPDDRGRLLAAVAESLKADGSERLGTELRIVRPNGEIRWFSFRGQVLFRETSSGREPVEQIGACVDFTDRSSILERELAHANRVATMGEMASSLAHELAQPLATVANNLAACRRGIVQGSLSRDDIIQALDESTAESLRAGEIIKRLRQFLSRIPPARSSVQMADLVRQVAELCRPELARHHVRLECLVANDAPIVWGDRVQLQQVLINLISNSIDAVRTNQPDERWIQLRVEAQDGQIAICVSDNGPGISELLAAEVFEPYYTTKHDGMGMGLAICRTIVKAHQGRIWYEGSQAGGGRFQIVLPTSSEK